MSARGRRSANPLEKKIPENPKYKHVRPTVDTGASLSKYLEKMEELKRNYNFRKDEIFKRMKIPTFVQLIVQVADFDMISADAAEHHSPRSDRPDTADLEVARIQMTDGTGSEMAEDTSQDPSEISTSRSRLEQVINGIGEIDLNSQPPSQPPMQKPLSMMGLACPYLLLDVRDKDSFDECHIISAKSYPTAMLARSVNYESKEMLSYKNQPGKIIVVYDEDERISHRAATTLVQRGYDNLFMLSGGLKVAYKLFPESLIAGTVPASIIDEVTQSKKGLKVKELPQKIPANIENFTAELIERLSNQLDSCLPDKSVGSRLSQASRQNRASSIASASSASTLGRKPFKC